MLEKMADHFCPLRCIILQSFMMPCYTDMDYRTLGSATCERSSPFGWILSRRFYQEYFHAEHDHADLASRSLHLGERLAEHRDVLPGLVCSLVQLLALSLNPQFWLRPRTPVCSPYEIIIRQDDEHLFEPTKYSVVLL